MIFPSNNLPTSSQPWAREITKQLSNIIDSDNSNQINNTARDNQLNSSIIALGSVVTGVTNALQEIGLLQDTVLVDGDPTKIDGANIKVGTLSASQITTGTLNASLVNVTNINADNIESGTITGNFISGGTITGVTLQTSSSGRRVILGGTNISFYDSDGAFTGFITAAGSDSSAYMEIGAFTNNDIRFELGSIELSVPGAFMAVQTGDGGSPATAYVSGTLISMGGNVVIDGKMTSSTGVQSIFSYNNAVGGAARDLYITSAGNLGTIESSLKVKEEIQDLNLPIDAVFSVMPKTFKFKVDIKEFGREDAITTAGFIAEDMHDLGLTHFVNYGPNQEVEGISYTRYVVALQAAVRNLNERILTLENGA